MPKSGADPASKPLKRPFITPLASRPSPPFCTVFYRKSIFNRKFFSLRYRRQRLSSNTLPHPKTILHTIHTLFSRWSHVAQGPLQSGLVLLLSCVSNPKSPPQSSSILYSIGPTHQVCKCQYTVILRVFAWFLYARTKLYLIFLISKGSDSGAIYCTEYPQS